MSEPDPLELAATIGATFDAVAVPYVLDGSLASTALGEPRATLDIDVAADLRDECIGDWLRLLGPDFSKDERRIRDEVRRRGSFQLVHRPTMTRVDVFVPEWTGVHLWKWQNRRRLVLDEQSQRGIDVTAPEGIVVQKLSWFRDGGATSERQWRDVLGVLKAQRDFLDRADMAVWARKMGVADLLERALVDAGLAGGGGRNARGWLVSRPRTMEPRQRLITRINRGGDFHGPETALPLVTLEEFFVGNDDAGSIGCNLPGGVLPREFHAALLVVRERPDVSDVRVQVTMHDDPDAWPFADTVWVVTSASPQAVRSWLPERLAPDEVFDGLPRDRLLESLPIPAGQRAVGLWYD